LRSRKLVTSRAAEAAAENDAEMDAIAHVLRTGGRRIAPIV